MPISPGPTGCIWVRIPIRNWSDGWYRTGDAGFRDAEGLYYIVDRVKELIKFKGFQVPPAELEALLVTHPDVADVAVVARADEVLGEVGVAVVVPRSPQHPPSLEDLRAQAAATLAHHKLPESLLVADSLPLTAMQKVDRRSLKGLVDPSVS